MVCRELNINKTDYQKATKDPYSFCSIVQLGSFDSEAEEDAVLDGGVFSFPWMNEVSAEDIR